MAAVRVVSGLGYGLVTFIFLKNADGVGDYISEVMRTTVHFMSRAPERLLGDRNGRDLGDLNEKLDRLASMRRETVHVHHGDSKSSWVTTIAGGAALIVVVAHVSGLFDFSGFMYVTQAKFKSATDALKEGIDVVTKALQSARKDLLERIGVLEAKMDEANAELRDQITSTSNAVRDDLAKVSSDVKDVGSVVGGLEMKLGSIDGGMGDLRSAMEKANKGIQLLCHVVAESYRHNSASQRDPRWYADLLIYTKNAGLENTTEPQKQLKQNGEGNLMRLISGTNIGGSADNGGGLVSVRETLNRQLGVFDVKPMTD